MEGIRQPRTYGDTGIAGTAAAWSAGRSAAIAAVRPAGPHARVLQLGYRGSDGLEPDFPHIAQALGGVVRLLHGGVDRIQGRTQGQLLIALHGAASLPDLNLLTQGLRAIAHDIKELGYVAESDHCR